MVTPKQQGRVQVKVLALADGVGFDKDMLVPKGQTVEWCLNASGLWSLHPTLVGGKVGIFGKLVTVDTVVEDGDRIEVYVPCDADAAKNAREFRRAIVKPTISGDNNQTLRKND